MKQKYLIAALLCAASPIALAESIESIDEVVITATRVARPLKRSLVDTTVVNQQDIQNSQAVDVPALLKNLAGVEIYQSGGIGKQSSLFMRGTNSSHTLVLLDGVRINSATSGATAIDQIMLDQIERIEVVRGNVSSLYGSEAIGGVIQIFTRRGKGVPAFNVSGGIGSQNTKRVSAGYGGELANTSFNVQVAKFMTDGVSAINAGLVDTANPDADGYDNLSLSANIKQTLGEGHNLFATAYTSEGKIQYDKYGWGVSATDIDTSKSKLQKISIGSENQLASSWHSRLNLSQGLDDLQSATNGISNSSLSSTSNQLAWQNTLALNSSSTVLLGVERLDQHISSNNAYTKTARQVNSLLAGYTGNYGIQQVQVNVRHDRYSDFGNANTGLLGYGIEISEAWRFSANLSTAYKAPTFNDLFAPAGWGANDNLQPEKSINKEVAVHYARQQQQFDIIYFDNKISDLIAADNTWTLQNLNSSRINGVEASYAVQLEQTAIKAALTRQDPRDEQTGLSLLRRAKLFSNVSVTQQMGAWKLGGEWQHNGTREDYDINTFTRTTLPAYNLVNASLNYTWDKHINVNLRAENLLNQDYMLAHGYNTLGRSVFIGVSYQ
ncbi:MAG: TonB-dependent receptor [Gallionellaceae bacterium]